MHILDTDTLSRLHAGEARVRDHKERFDPAEVVTTVITRIEILRGRFDFVPKATGGGQLRKAQDWLRRSEEQLSQITIVPLDATAANQFDNLRQNKKFKRIGRAQLLIGDGKGHNVFIRLAPKTQVRKWAK
jgi:tRNA(fMet)-specific endonuclease VapC